MRKLVACLACRNSGTRLYGKPMQNLDISGRISVIKHMVDMFKKIKSIESIVLGISEGPANLSFIDFAKNNSVGFIVGREESVFERLISCCKYAGGTDIFRVTTESPFTCFEYIDLAWKKHLENDNDITILDDRVPEGCHFEIIKLKAFEYVDSVGKEIHKKDFCTLYFRDNLGEFKFERIPVDKELMRIADIRLTIDYPEDLIICREIYNNLHSSAPLISVRDIIGFLDKNENLKSLVKKYVSEDNFWRI